MKRITICVPDNVVGTIVSLVAEYATELHVVTEGKTPISETPGRKRASRGTQSEPEDTRIGKLVMGMLPADGTQVLRAAAEDELERQGFARASLSPIISKLSAKKLIIRLGTDHIALAVGNA